jgi:Uma2 family endonuclease
MPQYAAPLVGGVLRFLYAGMPGGLQCHMVQLDSIPQPEVFVRIRPSYGGQSLDQGEYPAGAPELIVEICETSTEVDFGPKLTLYERACVREYVTIELLRKRIVWRFLDDGTYKPLPPEDGVLRIADFSGIMVGCGWFLGR